MKIYNKRTFILGIAALIVALLMTAASFRAPTKLSVLSAETAWLLFFLALYAATRSPQTVEEQQKRAKVSKAVYRKRFGVFGAIMPYTPVLVMWGGIALSRALIEDIDVQMLLSVASMVVGGFVALWLGNLVNLELKAQEEMQHEDT